MQVIGHARFGDSAQRKYFQLAAVGALGLLPVVWPLKGFNPLVSMAIQVGGLFMLATGLHFLGRAFNANVGNVHEDYTSAELAKLDDDHLLVKNLVIPGSKRGDIDLVVAGPFGVVAIEQKFRSSKLKCVGDQWYWVKPNGYAMRTKSISSQTRGHEKGLRSALKKIGYKGPVTAAAVFNDRVELDLENPTVTVLRRKELLAWLGSLPATASGAQDALKALSQAAMAEA